MRIRIALFYMLFLAALLLIAELILSIADPEAILVKADDPEQIYTFYPERSGQSHTAEYSALVQTDSLGLRSCSPQSRELSAAAETETVASAAAVSQPILVLGDSFAEGWGVSCQESFAGRLALAGYRVFNAGIHGGTPPYFVLRHRHYRDLAAYNTLIVQIFDNDLDDIDKVDPFLVWQNDRVAAAEPRPLLGWPFLSRLVKERALYRMLKRTYYKFAGAPQPIKYYKPNRLPPAAVLDQAQALGKYGPLRSIADLKAAYNGQFLFYDPAELPGALWQNRLRKFEASLRQLIEEARPESRILLVYIPAREVLAPHGIRGDLPAQPPLETLRAQSPLYQVLVPLQSPRVQLIDGMAVFQGQAEGSYFPFDAHLNAVGHARLATAIALRLKDW